MLIAAVPASLYAEGVNIGDILGESSNPLNGFQAITISDGTIFGVYNSSNWFVLDSDFQTIAGPTSLGKRSAIISSAPSGAYIIANSSSSTRDPFYAYMYETATESMDLIGNITAYPSSAFSDTGGYRTIQQPDGTIYQSVYWKYADWDDSRANYYIRYSTDNMASWSNWIALPRIGDTRVSYWHYGLVSHENRLFLVGNDDWSYSRVIINEFDTLTKQWGVTNEVSAGEYGSLFINHDTGRIAVAYLDSGTAYVKYAHIDSPSSWSSSEAISNSTNLIGINSNIHQQGAFDNIGIHFLVATSATEQKLLRWDGDSQWQETLLEKTHTADYDYQTNVTADGVGGAFVFSHYTDGSVFASRIGGLSDLTSGLVAYYPFDGSANDSSVNGHDGTISGGATFTDGISGQAINFDGINDKVTVSHSDDLNSANGTWSLWIYPHGDGGYAITKDTLGYNNDGKLYVSTDSVSFLIDGNNQYNYASSASRTITQNKWHHVAATWGNDGMKLYIDGSLSASNLSYIQGIDTVGDLVFGGLFNDYNNPWFDGKMDEVRIYNRALSEIEISKLFGMDNSDSAILTVSPSSRNVAAGAETMTFTIANAGGGTMSWTAVTGDPWLDIISANNGTNDGDITVSYGANTTGESRTGTVTVNALGVVNSPQLLVIKQSSEISIDGKLDHFEFSTISSPQVPGTPFLVTITAKDAYSNTVTDFNGKVYLVSDLGNVSPTYINFLNGITTRNITFYDVGKTRLKCDGSGCRGESNRFEVASSTTCIMGITGKLVDRNLDPIFEAKVQVIEEFTGEDFSSEVVAETVTDSSGRYAFNNIPCGSYLLTAIALDCNNNEIKENFDRIRSDGEKIIVSDHEMQISCSKYGTPVIFVPGMMGSSSSDDSSPFPYLIKNGPDMNLHIHTKSRKVKLLGVTVGNDPVGWGELDEFLSEDFLTFDCPWDWRLGADEAARKYLRPKIDEALKRSVTGKVHIVAHSMGGLVARALIQSDILHAESGEKYYKKIDKLAMIGTPHLGSCNPYYMWGGGDCKELDDLTRDGVWVRNFYTNTIQRLWEETYGKNKWGDKKCCKILDFLVNEVCDGYQEASSLRQLMTTEKFLSWEKDSSNQSAWWDLDSDENRNKWLINLNKSEYRFRMTSYKNHSDLVYATIFAGNYVETIEAIYAASSLSKECENSKINIMYKDGTPKLPHSWSISPDKDNYALFGLGDGTVPYSSAIWPTTDEAGPFASLNTYAIGVKHSKLTGQFNQEICEFLTGEPCFRTAVRGEDLPATMLTFSINNGHRLLVVDDFGRRSGFDPSTGEVLEEILATSLKSDGKETVVTLFEPATGNYQLTYYGNLERNFRLKTNYLCEDGDYSRIIENGFCPDAPITVQISFNPANDPVLALTPAIESCECLACEPYEANTQLYQLYSKLQWNNVDGAVSYRVYAKADTEPYFRRIAEIAAATFPSYYETEDLWRSSEDTPLMAYVVSYVDSAGDESFFSNIIYNDDQDHDGLSDIEELNFGTQVTNPDSDGDQLSDGDEFFGGLSPTDPDSDADGYNDYDEVNGGSNPTSSASLPDLYVDAKGYCNGKHLCFPTIGEAYAFSAGTGSIKAADGSYLEALLLNQGKDISFAGGWSDSYDSVLGETAVIGSLTISSGCLTVEKLTIGGTPTRRDTIPDTGQNLCYNFTEPITCPVDGGDFFGQDAHYERPRLYTKLDIYGNALSENATEWFMVRDEVTGLVWEVKQAKDGKVNYENHHDADNVYTWYDGNPETNGGEAGVAGFGTDTTFFINDLNARNFGGRNNWRLPALKELSYLVNSGSGYPEPAISNDFFPATMTEPYFSSTTNLQEPANVGIIHFSSGLSTTGFPKADPFYVRAVSSEKSTSYKPLIDNGDGTVTDPNTNLMWQQSDGPMINWQQALNYCENLELAAYDDWRLPDRNEIQSLMDYGKCEPCLDEFCFPGQNSNYYWSSTSDFDNDHLAWEANFFTGSVFAGKLMAINSKEDERNPVRAVRLVQYIPSVLESIEIVGESEIEEGGSLQLISVAHFANGGKSDVSSIATWNENSAYATISSIGNLTASIVYSDQTCLVSVEYGGLQTMTNITIKNQASPPTPSYQCPSWDYGLTVALDDCLGLCPCPIFDFESADGYKSEPSHDVKGVILPLYDCENVDQITLVDNYALRIEIIEPANGVYFTNCNYSESNYSGCTLETPCGSGDGYIYLSSYGNMDTCPDLSSGLPKALAYEALEDEFFDPSLGLSCCLGCGPYYVKAVQTSCFSSFFEEARPYLLVDLPTFVYDIIDVDSGVSVFVEITLLKDSGEILCSWVEPVGTFAQ
ncbi:MAG: DUF1566 domain-containing protein [Deltaproteobacteria bacterium]|nr:DUF1566 domain-containing protein [Candidatus Tharpella aukensis]